MTRFARAKGSKASNLKNPEDSTPWEVMKEQLINSKKDIEESKKREEAEKQRIDNYSKFLKDQRVQKRKATWCEFPNEENKNKHNSHDETKSEKSSNRNIDGDIPNSSSKKKKNNKNKKANNDIQFVSNENVDVNDNTNVVTEISKKKNKKGKNHTLFKDDIGPKESNNLPSENTEEINKTGERQNDSNKNNVMVSKKKKKNKKNKSNNNLVEQNGDDNLKINNCDDNAENTKKSTDENDKSNNQINHNNIARNDKKKKSKKNIGDKAVRRKPINDNSFQLIINGKDVELVRFDGFPIMKKDAERLQELKNSMIKKGIPKSEVQRTMKLERRRAEKALARLKRDVCYNCRKGGHNLSDCPDLKTNIPGVDSAEGVCFKCGSTEHRQFECKVQRDKEFRFATCFICKESGHIARQCPDNPKGLYPNGGCCKLCGDVTHMRKDCPTTKDQKEGTSIKLQTLDDDNIEDIGQTLKSTPEETPKKPKKIKF